MNFYKKTLLFSNLGSLNTFLIHDKLDKKFSWFYVEKYAMTHVKIKNRNLIYIWKTPTLWNFYIYNYYNKIKHIIGLVEYSIDKDSIKINYMFTNNKLSILYYDHILDMDESLELNSALHTYIKKIAKQENKKKIIIDIHHNLQIYNMYYKNNGYLATNHRYSDNPNWIEIEYNL